MKQYLKENLSANQLKLLRSFVKRTLSLGNTGNLNKLALIWNTDKWGSHWYTQHYNTHFHALKSKALNILEIGVGGYDDPEIGGNSLRTWKYYFKNSHIYGVDIFDKKKHEEKRIKIFKGSQVDKDFLEDVCRQIGDIDIIIDDGSHVNAHVIETFKILFPLLKEDGIYAVEDIETAYWPEYGGDSMNLDNDTTSINFFKKLVDGLNHQEFMRSDYEPTYFDMHIKSIHFYHNMVFIYKGKNDEVSVQKELAKNRQV